MPNGGYMPQIKVGDKMVDSAIVLISQVAKLSQEGKTLPTGADLEKAAKAAGTFDVNSTVTAQSTSYELGKRANRSKRKMFFTAAGPAVAIGVTALAGGPVTWVVVGGALVGAAIGIGMKKAWRNARAAYYESQYLKKVGDRWVFKDDKSALDGVRYVLKKKKLSKISDDVKELFEAIQEYEKRRGKPLTSCRKAAELAYWYHRVGDLAGRLQEHFECFEQFYDFVVDRLDHSMRTSTEHDAAMSDANIEKALCKVHRWVNLEKAEHDRAKCTARSDSDGAHRRAFPHNCCYAHNSSGKAVAPMVSTSTTLTLTLRRQFIRLLNDAAYRCAHGESMAVASYTDERGSVQRKLDGTCILDLTGSDAPHTPRALTTTKILWDKLGLITPERIGLPRRGQDITWPDAEPAPTMATRSAPTSVEELVAPSSSRPTTASLLTSPSSTRTTRPNLLASGSQSKPQVDEGLGGRMGGSAIGSTIGSGVGFGVTQARVAALQGGSTVLPEMAKNAIVTGSTSGAGLVLALIQACCDALNLRNEAAALREELAKPDLGEVNMERVMTALRTLLKDGVFETGINEAAKMIEYGHEFAKAMRVSVGSMHCAAAWELVYRPLKAIKHLDELNKHLPLISMFASIATALCEQADYYEGRDALRIAEVVKVWMDDGDHSCCKTSSGKRDICYAPSVEEAEDDLGDA